MKISKSAVILIIIIIIILIICSAIFLFYLNNIKKTEIFESIDNLFEGLRYVNELFNQHQIKHWIMYGTLLGAIRGNDLIPYDYDIDFGAFVSDADRILSLNDIVRKDGYRFTKAYSSFFSNNKLGSETKIWRVSLKIIRNEKIIGDIYLYQRFPDGFMRRYDPNQAIYFWPKSTFPYWFISELDNVRIRNSFFPAPKSAEILLRHWYGVTWKTPIKAKAQGGYGDNRSDYYGGAIDVELKFLTDYLKSVEGLELVPHKPLQINYVIPPSQAKWIEKNE